MVILPVPFLPIRPTQSLAARRNIDAAQDGGFIVLFADFAESEQAHGEDLVVYGLV